MGCKVQGTRYEGKVGELLIVYVGKYGVYVCNLLWIGRVEEIKLVRLIDLNNFV